MEIKNQVAVITGGGSGMGAATARHLSEQGAKVILLDMNLAQAEKVAKETKGLAIACDVTQAATVESAIQRGVEQFGSVSIVVNCAGVAPAQRIVGREGAMPLEDFRRVIDINLIGTFNVMRVCAAQMMQQKPMNSDEERGVIINTASIAAFEGQIGQAAYSASKGGVVALTLPAARELAKWGIRVMTIAPGIIATPMMAGLGEEVQTSLAAAVPFPHRLGEANEYARLVETIIKNAYLNGSVIRLDGALRMAAK